MTNIPPGFTRRAASSFSRLRFGFRTCAPRVIKWPLCGGASRAVRCGVSSHAPVVALCALEGVPRRSELRRIEDHDVIRVLRKGKRRNDEQVDPVVRQPVGAVALWVQSLAEALPRADCPSATADCRYDNTSDSTKEQRSATPFSFAADGHRRTRAGGIYRGGHTRQQKRQR